MEERKSGSAIERERRRGDPSGSSGLRAAPFLPFLLVSFLLVLVAMPAAAQVPDSVAVAADSLAADSLEAEPAVPRGAVSFAGPAPGRVVTPTPTRRPVLGAAELLGALPGVFHHDLGVPGAPDGVAFGGLAPHRVSLALDGVPAEDLFSGRPAWELLPLDALAPLRLAPRYGAPAGVDASLRAFAASVPVTELRYRTARTGIQFISATHAQTRRPGFLRALGGDRARLQALVHVGGRRADGEFAGAAVRGWQLLARVGIALPAFSLEVTERHGRDESGARSGLVPTGAFETVFDPDRATVLDPQATRETVRNDLAATLRLPLLDEPLTATGYWTAETFHYANPLAAPDTTTARGDRVGFRLTQPLRLGPNRLLARAEGWLDRLDTDSAFADPGDVSALHLAVLDSLALGPFDVELEGGWHRAGDASFPALGARIAWPGEVVRAEAGVRRAGALPSRMQRGGFGGLLRTDGVADEERTLALDAALGLRIGPFDLDLRAEVLRQSDPTALVLTDTVATFVRVDGAFERATGALALGWRDRAARGLYVRSQVNAHAFLNPDDSPTHRREADAVPPLWGHVRLGWRARDLFEGSLVLDLALRGRFWSAFRGRTLHAPTALYALPFTTDRRADARGTLDVLAEAGVGGGRATAFVLYENVLARRAYPGAYVVPVHPLPGPRLRFGIFWLLAN